MDYQAMWNDLKEELKMLHQERVGVIDPIVVIAYMGYIEERQYYREQLEEKEVK